MEKRILLSFVLSFLILITWQRLFPVSRLENVLDESQVIENKEVVENEQLLIPEEFPPVLEKRQTEEKTVVVNNGKIEAVLSTRGARLVQAKILEYDAVLPISDIFGLKGIEGEDFTIVQEAGNEVVFSSVVGDFEIGKAYRFSEEDFLIYIDITVKNAGKIQKTLDSSFLGMQVNAGPIEKGSQKERDRNLLEYSVLSEGKVFRKTGAYKFTQKEIKRVDFPAKWIGFRDRYYCAIVKPEFSTSGYAFSPNEKEEDALSIYTFSDKIDLNPGEIKKFSSVFFVGPQKASVLEKYDMDFEKIQVYFRAKFFDSIAKIIEDLVILMHKIVPNWGVAIILVSMLIYGAMYPMTMKSMLSMRKMQSLQPKIVILREKYEKNPQKLNQEIMKLYAENKVNPLGGCLPLLLQMPVFICLYQMIWRSVLFKGAGFLWIKDLSEPDRLFILNKSFPIIGNEINILPAIILVLMVLQQRMTSKNMVITDPNQLAQQKMMTFMMPVVLLFVFYHIASGLTLYLAVFYLLSSFMQWQVSKTAKAVS